MSEDFEKKVGTDRRTFVKRLVIGTAFAAPVVSSFTMAGVQSAFGGTPKSRTMASSPNTTTPPIPGASQPPALPGFPSNVICYTVLAGGLNVTIPDGSASLQLFVPPNALPVGTSLCVYRADLSALSAVVPAGQTPVSGYAVVWTAPGGGKPDALAPITLTVTDPSVVATGAIFQLDKTTGQPVPVGSSSPGVWVVTFVVDPGFVVTDGITPVSAAPNLTG